MNAEPSIDQTTNEIMTWPAEAETPSGFRLCHLDKNPNRMKKGWMAQIFSARTGNYFNGAGKTPFKAVALALCNEKIFRQGWGGELQGPVTGTCQCGTCQ